MAEIKSGGQLGSLKNEPKVTSINVYCEDNSSSISLNINNSSLSYLTIEEAVLLRNELNNALKIAIGV
jgi:hypothetical protein